MNILFFGAHPDDLEILCGGTIAKCASLGHDVWMAVATNGNVGSPTLGKAEIGAIRQEEALTASRLLGAKELVWIDENDEFLFDDEKTRLKFVDAIRQAKAELIVTHNPNDYHPDHIACSKLATDARILSAVRLIETNYPHLAKAPELLYMDSVAGLQFLPQHFVDISSTFPAKSEALLAHQSQSQWLKTIFNQEITELIDIQSSFRGLQAGVKYAEAFVSPAYWPKGPASLPFLT